MVFIDDNNLINESGTNTTCCLIIVLKFAEQKRVVVH